MANERLRFHEDLHDGDGALAVSGLANQLEYMAEHTPRIDPIFKAYCLGESGAIREEDFGRFVIGAFRSRQQLDRHFDRPSVTYRGAVDLMFRNFQALLLQRDIYGFGRYPDDPYLSEHTWRKLPHRMLFDTRSEHADQNREEFELNLMTRTVQTNVADRYISHWFIMDMLKDRLGNEPHVLDIGTSDTLGLIKLRSPEFRFQQVVVAGTGQTGKSKRAISKILNESSHVRRPTGPSLGVDLVARNPQAQAWVQACTYRGMEWRNPTSLKEWTEMHEWDRRNEDGQMGVYFFQADAASEQDMEEVAEKSPVKKFEVVTATTMLHQLGSEERERVLRNARRFLTDNGVLIIQDYCNKHPEDPSRLEFTDDWRAFTYNTLIELAERPQEFHEVFSWETGRCRRVRLGDDFIRLSEGALHA